MSNDPKKPEKGQEREVNRGSEATPKRAAQDATVDTKEQGEVLKASLESNPDKIDDVSGNALMALRPGMTVSEANELMRLKREAQDKDGPQAETKASEDGKPDVTPLSFDYDGKTYNSTNLPRGERVKEPKADGPDATPGKKSTKAPHQLSTADLTSDVFKAIVQHGPPGLRGITEPVVDMRGNLKDIPNTTETRTNVDNTVKQAYLDSLTPEQKDEIRSFIQAMNPGAREQDPDPRQQGVPDAPLLNLESPQTAEATPLLKLETAPEVSDRQNRNLIPDFKLPANSEVPLWMPRLHNDLVSDSPVLLAEYKENSAPKGKTATLEATHQPQTKEKEHKKPPHHAARSHDHSDEVAKKRDVREVEELRRPAANGPSGTLVFHDKGGYHQMRCVDGKVFDANKKQVGDIKDGGTVKINGHAAKIDGADNKSQYMFIGSDSKGDSVRYLPPGSAKQLTGMMTSFDGKTQYAVVGGNIFNKSGSFLGHLTENGRVERLNDGPKGLGNSVDVNVAFNRFKFEGMANGQQRFFISSNEASTGKFVVPANELPGAKSDSDGMVELKVKQGMLIDSHGKQLGLLMAPGTETGKLEGGSVLWFGSKKPIPMSEFKNATFDLNVLGEGGLSGRNLKGVCLGGKAGLFDAQEAIDVETTNSKRKSDSIDDTQHLGLGIAKWEFDELTGQHKQEKTKIAQGDATFKSDLNSIIDKGVTNPARLAELMARTQRERKELEGSHPPEQSKDKSKDKPDAKKEIGVPPLNAQTVDRVDGTLIMDSTAFQIRKGQLHRVHDDGHGHLKPDAKASGKLLANYKVQLDGHSAPIDLARENRVLMKYTVGGDTQHPHRIVGMGRSRMSDKGIAVQGGLVSVEDLSRTVKQTAHEEIAASKDYFKNKDVMSQAVQGVSDLLSGSKAEQSISSAEERLNLMTRTLDRACDAMFTNNPTNKDVNANLIDHQVRTVQNVMDTFGLEVASGKETRADLKQAQSQMSEASTMAVVTVATMGVGTGVAAMANAGKFATFGKFAHAASIGSRIGGGALAGGTIRTVASLHEGQTVDQGLNNFKTGAIEGGIMSAANFTSSFDKAQKLTKGLAIAKAGATEVETSVAGALADGGIKQTEAWLLKSGMGRTIGSLTDKQAAAVRLTTIGVDNATQSIGFGVANYYRESGNRPNAKITDFVNANTVGMGTAFGMLGHGTGELLGREAQFVNKATELPGVGRVLGERINLGDAAEHLITQSPGAATSSFTIGVFNTLPTEFDNERMRIAQETGMDVQSVGMNEMNLWRMINYSVEGASLNALASMPLLAGHSQLERSAGIHTEEFFGTPKLGKSEHESLLKPVRESFGQQIVKEMQTIPATPESVADKLKAASVELKQKALGWSPDTVSKVERYNNAREVIAAFPEDLRPTFNKLLGDVGEKGVKSDARLRIVENLFKANDLSIPGNREIVHDCATRMLECMRPMKDDQALRPGIKSLDDIFTPEQVALIKQMDEFQEKLKPSAISKDLHQQKVDAYYNDAWKSAPGGAPAQERILHLVVGPPGAGKSSSLVDPFKMRDRCMEIDSDHLKPQIEGYVAKFRGRDHVGFGSGAVHPISSKIANDVLMKAIENGDNIIHPILGRTPEGVLDTVMIAKAHGYKVAIHIADIPPDESARRAFDRGQKEVEHGKRQIVPPTYSLNAVQWGPQITFERLATHMQNLIDEMNYCNTNVPRGVTPDLIQRSPQRIRDGVERFRTPKKPEKIEDAQETAEIKDTQEIDLTREIDVSNLVNKSKSTNLELHAEGIGDQCGKLPYNHEFVNVTIGGEKFELMYLQGWYVPKDRPFFSTTGHSKIHVNIGGPEDLKRVQATLIPALQNTELYDAISGWKTENPLSADNNRPGLGKDQHAKAFTIYFDETQINDIDNVALQIDRLLLEKGLGLNEPLKTDNIDGLTGKSNRVGIVRDTFDKSCDERRIAAAVDEPLQNLIENKYKGKSLTKEQLAEVEAFVELPANTLFYDSDKRICVKLSGNCSDYNDGVYASEAGAGKKPKEYTDRWALYKLYEKFGLDPAKTAKKRNS